MLYFALDTSLQFCVPPQSKCSGSAFVYKQNENAYIVCVSGGYNVRQGQPADTGKLIMLCKCQIDDHLNYVTQGQQDLIVESSLVRQYLQCIFFLKGKNLYPLKLQSFINLWSCLLSWDDRLQQDNLLSTSLHHCF